MNTTYAVDHPEQGHIEYTDRKRYLWMLSLTMPLFPLLGIALYFAYDSQWLLGIPLLFSYVIVPLLDYAFGKRVALASPVNLWTVLKTVALTWTQQDVSTEARQLLELGTTLYERLGSLSGHTETLRRSIEKTVESYNAMIGSLESRVLVTARKFPGIDESKLLASPGAVTASPRPLTSPEMLEGLNAEEGTEADLGELRERISRDGSH